MHRLKKPLFLLNPAEGGDGGAGGGSGSGSPDDGAGSGSGATFTQADVDAAVSKIAAKIRAEERQKAAEKFADYDDLKSKAGEAKTLEERIAAMEKRATEAEISALRAKYAADVPEKLRPLLTGTTDDELKAQRDLIVEGESERKKRSNHVPGEGNNPKPAAGDDEVNLVRELFGRANAD